MVNKEIKIIIDEHAGFCAGVKRAIKLAEDELDNKGKVYSLGELIHNRKEIERLKRKGLICVEREHLVKGSIEADFKLLFRAHGEGKDVHSKAKQLPNELIDGTCSIVKRLQKMVEEAYNNGYSIILIGKKHHPEVLGLQGHCEQSAYVVLSKEEIDKISTDKRISVFAQTTTGEKLFDCLSAYIKSRYSDAEINKTICNAVLKRRDELSKFIKKIDTLIFVGGKHSSNTKVLYDFCKSLLDRTYFVSDKKEIKPEHLHGARTIGISGSASTPRWLMDQIRDYIRDLKLNY